MIRPFKGFSECTQRYKVILTEDERGELKIIICNNPNGLRTNESLAYNSGHYIELMAGFYSNKQPDYSWLETYETNKEPGFRLAKCNTILY